MIKFGLISVGVLLVVACGHLPGACSQTGGCSDVGCAKGKMCIEEAGNVTSCVCPQVCLDERITVCSVYVLEFNNLCELHKFACRYEIPIGVASMGPCDVQALRQSSGQNVSECARDNLLQFGERYLEWILISRRRLVNRYYQVKESEKGHNLPPDMRKELAQWEFDRVDFNRDGVLSGREINSIIGPLLFHERCIYGFVMSCDVNKNSVIDKQEWLLCFPAFGIIRD
ncbi:testican-2 [Nematostella vectensis]|uniref:testican-2 n=1 Tax=Nematostella vectensis TaxID=45351 RepID=UPI00139063F2|nr:testican-2 [Nematostella vectensis]